MEVALPVVVGARLGIALRAQRQSPDATLAIDADPHPAHRHTQVSGLEPLQNHENIEGQDDGFVTPGISCTGCSTNRPVRQRNVCSNPGSWSTARRRR
jgi:hypothetical protein